MGTYKLLLKDEKSMQYAYWPEGHEDKQPGIIVVDFELELIYLKKPSPEDWTVNYKLGKPGSWHALMNVCFLKVCASKFNACANPAPRFRELSREDDPAG